MKTELSKFNVTFTIAIYASSAMNQNNSTQSSSV